MISIFMNKENNKIPVYTHAKVDVVKMNLTDDDIDTT